MTLSSLLNGREHAVYDRKNEDRNRRFRPQRRLQNEPTIVHLSVQVKHKSKFLAGYQEALLFVVLVVTVGLVLDVILRRHLNKDAWLMVTWAGWI